LRLKLYTNNVEDGLNEAQINALDENDFVEADFHEYQDVLLDAAHYWTFLANDPAANGKASATGEQHEWIGSGESIAGYYVVRGSDGGLVWHEPFTSPFDMDSGPLRITPKFTFRDEVDSA